MPCGQLPVCHEYLQLGVFTDSSMNRFHLNNVYNFKNSLLLKRTPVLTKLLAG
jgi:hypothetical protein